MNAHSTTSPRANRLFLGALMLLLVLFAVSYLRARRSDRGTTYDDSPAAEAGARGDNK